MNVWKELKLKLDRSNQEREHKKQRRELNAKLEQIKSALLSKRDEDAREYLENTHTRDVLYHIDTPATVAMDYIEAASMRAEGIDKRDLRSFLDLSYRLLRLSYWQPQCNPSLLSQEHQCGIIHTNSDKTQSSRQHV